MLARTAGNEMDATFERGGRPRTVLAAIVADPALGPAVLSHPATLFGLLSEYMPDSPRETGPLLAAAQVDIPGALRDYVADGLPRGTAIQLAATRLAARTGLPDQACMWAVSEFALALGLATVGQLPRWPASADVAATDLVEPVLAAGIGEEPFARFGEPRWRRSPSPRSVPRSGRSLALRTSLATITGAVVVAAGATGIAMQSQHHVAGPRQPHPSYSHHSPGTRTAGARPSTASSGPGTASAHTSAARARGRTTSPHRDTASPHPSPASPAADPALIARDYIAGVNQRDWPWLWQLGGGNVVLTYQSDPGPLTYPQLVAEFQHTVWVTITSLVSTGDTVSLRVSALDSAGVTQYYRLILVIAGGRIISGSQYLLGP